MNDFAFTIHLDQSAYERLPQAQQTQLQADLKAAIQTVQSKYSTLNLNIQNQPTTVHEVAHR